MSTDEGIAGRAPIYARLLRLRRLKITGLMSFLLLECTVAVAILLALAELVSWWAVPLLPVLVAVMVKVNDMVGGSGGTRVAAAAEARSSRVSKQYDGESADRSPAPDDPRDVENSWDAYLPEPVDDEPEWESAASASRDRASHDAGDRSEWTSARNRDWADDRERTPAVGRDWADDRERTPAAPAVRVAGEWTVDRPTEEIKLPVELTGRPRQRVEPNWAGHAETTEFQAVTDDGPYTPSEYVTDSVPVVHRPDGYGSRAARDVLETHEFPGVRDTVDTYGSHAAAEVHDGNGAYGNAAYESAANGQQSAYATATDERAGYEGAHGYAAHDRAGYGYPSQETAYAHGYAPHDARDHGAGYEAYEYATEDYAAYEQSAHEYASYEQAAHDEAAYNSGRHAASPQAVAVTRPTRTYGEADANEPAEAAFEASHAGYAAYAAESEAAGRRAYSNGPAETGSAFPAQAVPATRPSSGGSLAAAGNALTARGRTAGEAFSADRSGRHQEPGPSTHAAPAAARTAANTGDDQSRPARPGSHAASYWSRVANGMGPGSPAASAPRQDGAPPNLPGAAAPRRAQLFGAAVRRSMAVQGQQIGGNALGGTTRGASTRGARSGGNDTGRHSRGDGNGSSRPAVRFNDRSFGRLRDA